MQTDARFCTDLVHESKLLVSSFRPRVFEVSTLGACIHLYLDECTEFVKSKHSILVDICVRKCLVNESHHFVGEIRVRLEFTSLDFSNISLGLVAVRLPVLKALDGMIDNLLVQSIAYRWLLRLQLLIGLDQLSYFFALD